MWYSWRLRRSGRTGVPPAEPRLCTWLYPNRCLPRILLLFRASHKASRTHLSVPVNHLGSKASLHRTGSAKMRAQGYTECSQQPLSSIADLPLFVPLVFISLSIFLDFLLIFATSSLGHSATAITTDMRHNPWADGGEGAGAALAWTQVLDSSGYSSCLEQQSWGPGEEKRSGTVEWA